MPVYAYTALDRDGRQTTGVVPADSRAEALNEVSGRGLSPVSVEEQQNKGSAASSGRRSNRVPHSSVDAFTRELANLLAAGLPLSRGLGLLRREVSHPGAKKAWTAIHDDVVGGVSLADSLAKFPKSFSTVYVAMVRAGEAGGFLPLVLQQISDFRSREQDLKGRVKAAMIYPAVLGFLGTGILIFLMTFFIPQFSKIFEDFGSNLPLLTQLIVGASNNMVRIGPVAAVVVVLGIVGTRRLLTTEMGRRGMERAVLGMPAVGRVAARFALVRFCRMLGTLVGAGVPLVASLRVAREALGNQTLADAVGFSIEEVQRGASLARSLASCPRLFPPSVVEMVTVAEETGRLDEELQRLSVAYEQELDRRLRMLVALLEPLMLFVMAAVIGTVVVGMLLPVFTLQELMR